MLCTLSTMEIIYRLKPQLQIMYFFQSNSIKIFIILPQKQKLWVSLEAPHQGTFYLGLCQVLWSCKNKETVN